MLRLAKIVREQDFACDIVDSETLSDAELDYFQNEGFSWQEVEQAWNGQWYISGKCPAKPEEVILNELRSRREIECFSIINRGQFWYDLLTEEQKAELRVWYQNWLDVTDTKVIPTKPSWLD